MVVSNLLKLGLALSFVALSGVSEASPLVCWKAHAPGTSNSSTYQKFGERGRVERRAVTQPETSEIKGAADEVMMAFPGGGLFLNEKPLSAKAQAGVMEFIRLWTYTRQIQFPAKALLDKETFTLGLPLGNGYTVELVYKSFSRNENIDSEGPQSEIQDRFLLSDIHALGPGGVFLKGSGQIRDIDGKLTQRQVLDLTDLPGLSDFDFLAHVPNEISGATLVAFQKMAPQLSNFSKQELWDLARKDSYYKLRWMASTRSFTAMLQNYHWRGIGKNWVKYITFPLVGAGLYLGAKAYFPEQVQNVAVTVQKAITLDHFSWIQVILNRMSTSPQTPIAVREQLDLLKGDFKKSVNADSLLTPMTEKYPVTLDNRPRFQIGKEEYIWVQRSFDKAENKDITLIYAAKISPQTGMAYLAVTPVDPAKYHTLIQYLESQGAFTLPSVSNDHEDTQ